MLGVWEMENAAGRIYEEWTRVSDSLFSGKSYIINDNDTLILESISLVVKDGEILYVPSVIEQNDGKPITFKLVADSGNTFVFENLKHDFPQRIIYINKCKDSLYAIIEGNTDTKVRKEEFIMNRKN
jgi:hypothetical protein